MNNLPNYKDKKVLILGLGINQGGVGATIFFSRAGAKVRVTDLKTKDELKTSLDQLKKYPGIEYVLGKHQFEDIDWADLIIRNPALKPDNPFLLYAQEKGKQVEMDLGIFIQFVHPQQIIGITGTKGKSTTASLIYEVLKESGREVVFAGNIGKSVLEAIPHIKQDTLVILELSSFQLQALGQHHVSPKWSVITNIFPDHLNYHGSMEKYIEAKRFIAEYQTSKDFLLLPKEEGITSKLSFLSGLKGQVHHFSLQDIPSDFTPQLPGEHNLANYAAALTLSQIFDIDKNTALRTMEQFKGVEYRLQLVKLWHGIKIYNDSAATNPGAAIQALKSLPDCYFICGGVNKKLDYQELSDTILKQAKSVYFLEGDATEEIKKHLSNIKQQAGDKIKGTYNNLFDLLKEIKKEIRRGEVILFSPGAASFNLFQNEFDRGRKFNQAVEEIFK